MTSGLSPLGPALAQALERMGSQGPGLPALGYGPTRIDAHRLSQLAEALRQALELSHGPHAEVDSPYAVHTRRVAFLLPSHPVFVVAWLATLAQGLLAIPFNPLLTPHELAAQLELTRPQLLLCHALTRSQTQALLSRVRMQAPDLPLPRVLELALPLQLGAAPSDPETSLQHPFERLLRQERADKTSEVAPSWPSQTLVPAPQRLQARAVCATHPALVLFTSGTTGQPRGIVHSHGSLSHNAHAIAEDWLGGVLGEAAASPLPGRLTGRVRHRMLGALPLCHNFGLNVTLNATLLHGGLLELLPLPTIRLLKEAVTGELAGNGTQTERTCLEPEGVTVLPLTPPLFRSLLLALPEGAGTQMRLAVSGGAALPGALRDQLQTRFPALALRDTYGLTEASLVCCTRPGSASTPAWGKPGTVGRPIQGVQIRLVDASGTPVAKGVPGEVCVEGPSLLLGVLEPSTSPAQAGLDTLALQPRLLELWPTGDIGVRDADGDLTLLDRKKDLILHGGQNVYPLEVEEVLYRHPQVHEALVFGVPDVRMGEKVMAAVSLSTKPGETQADAEALRSFCRGFLSAYKVPAEIQVRDALPRGSTGKLLRRALKLEWQTRHMAEPPGQPLPL